MHRIRQRGEHRLHDRFLYQRENNVIKEETITYYIVYITAESKVTLINRSGFTVIRKFNNIFFRQVTYNIRGMRSQYNLRCGRIIEFLKQINQVRKE